MNLPDLRILQTILTLLAVVFLFAAPLRADGDAASLFKAKCALCHSDDGSGNSPTGKAMKAKDLRSEEVQKESDAELAEVIAKGRGKMPAFGSKLSPDVIKSLVAYIRELPKKK